MTKVEMPGSPPNDLPRSHHDAKTHEEIRKVPERGTLFDSHDVRLQAELMGDPGREAEYQPLVAVGR